MKTIRDVFEEINKLGLADIELKKESNINQMLNIWIMDTSLFIQEGDDAEKCYEISLIK